ncbi:M20/M25/M40 family metallo-hydrolase, partial [Candidatus Sumerlaeota bacterium]|nr:M20/M25/M40 family metallo-hydrolase [Candidatus Sumerlaeota bacterium]
GTQVNLVPAQTKILIDRRVLPGETRASVHTEFEIIFDRIKKEFPNFRARQLEPLMVDPPLETEPDHPLVKTACGVTKKFKRPHKPIGVPYGTDGSKLSEIGIPTIVVGPGSIDQAHTADEFVDLDELCAGARYYFDLMNAGI